MFAGGCVGPFARRAASVVRAGKPDIETAARRVTGITDQPVAALTMPLRQIVTAHRLGLIAETLRQLTCLIRQTAHYAAARSPTRWIGQRFITRRSEEHTSELQSLMRISYAVFCLKKKK